ncbi:unnamed protein product [Phytophthora fragariaefolia]|uniref:Unnamed protein product n=1 Tax=Phytophthora fragariaefolia TaxID=1490495 RepID=A0A9W7CQM0_9STRA|nr:unnamed protein product [Phytophthora fragariaefolia]
MDDFKPYVNKFLVIDVPEEQDILLGMAWLKTNNPDIDWIEERVLPREQPNKIGTDNTVKKKKEKIKQEVKIPHLPEHPATKIGGKRVLFHKTKARWC